jgi:hypothetical protein
MKGYLTRHRIGYMAFGVLVVVTFPLWFVVLATAIWCKIFASIGEAAIEKIKELIK